MKLEKISSEVRNAFTIIGRDFHNIVQSAREMMNAVGAEHHEDIREAVMAEVEEAFPDKSGDKSAEASAPTREDIQVKTELAGLKRDLADQDKQMASLRGQISAGNQAVAQSEAVAADLRSQVSTLQKQLADSVGSSRAFPATTPAISEYTTASAATPSKPNEAPLLEGAPVVTESDNADKGGTTTPASAPDFGTTNIPLNLDRYERDDALADSAPVRTAAEPLDAQRAKLLGAKGEPVTPETVLHGGAGENDAAAPFTPSTPSDHLEDDGIHPAVSDEATEIETDHRDAHTD